MSSNQCSNFELTDFFFGELDGKSRDAVEAHVAACADCREELRILSATRGALLSVADEEPPRRIAFVSDKVFEPKWWQRIWTPGVRFGYAATAVLAGAIVAHGWMVRPQPVVVEPPAPTLAQVNVDAEIEKRVRSEVARAVALNDQAQTEKMRAFVNAALKDAKAEQREQLLSMAEYIERMQKRNTVNLSRAGLYQ